MIKLKNSTGWRVATAVVWAGVAISGWYWAQAGLPSKAAIVDAPVAAAPSVASSPAQLARLLGAPPAVAAGPGPGPADRFSLVGVIAGSAGQGAALISVDGKPALPFAIGAQIAPGYVLVKVGPREAGVSDGTDAQAPVVLSLPEKPAGAASSLPTMRASVPAVSLPEQATVTEPLPRADSRRQAPPSLRR